MTASASCYHRGMEFRDLALDATGQPLPDCAVGACYASDDGAWRISASDPARPAESEWQVWQHVVPGAPRTDRRTWVRRLPWVRLPLPDHARVVVEVLAALPANASWLVARARLRDALRTLGAALFFRGMHGVNVAVAGLASRLRARTGPSTEDVPEDPQDAGA